MTAAGRPRAYLPAPDHRGWVDGFCPICAVERPDGAIEVCDGCVAFFAATRDDRDAAT